MEALVFLKLVWATENLVAVVVGDAWVSPQGLPCLLQVRVPSGTGEVAAVGSDMECRGCCPPVSWGACPSPGTDLGPLPCALCGQNVAEALPACELRVPEPLVSRGWVVWSLQVAAAIQQPAVGEASVGCQGLPELSHTGAVLLGEGLRGHGGLTTRSGLGADLSCSPAGGLRGRGDSGGGPPAAHRQRRALLPDFPQAVPHAAQGGQTDLAECRCLVTDAPPARVCLGRLSSGIREQAQAGLFLSSTRKCLSLRLGRLGQP